MKKRLIPLSLAFLLTIFLTVVAAERSHHDWSHPAYHNNNWHHMESRADDSLPFKWHEHRDHYHGERIYDREWADRFPGLHPYRWHGEGFWYHGNRITDAMLFYNDSDELVSVGFMVDGLFIFFRDDHEGYENHDSFFLSWWNRH